jgi:hypothetical protein
MARGSSRAALSLEAGAGGQVTHGDPGAALGPSGGSWSHETRDGFRAALSQETRAGATGHVAAPELP